MTLLGSYNSGEGNISMLHTFFKVQDLFHYSSYIKNKKNICIISRTIIYITLSILHATPTD